ncbi:MAG: metallophosphoesterase, partial [Persicimonas sp.]
YGFNGKVPDLEWLTEQLAPSGDFKKAVVVSHTPPHREEFDSSLELPYAKLLESSPLVQLSLHGHEHRFSAGRNYGDVLYLVGDNADDRNYLVIDLSDDGVTYERIRF